MIYLLLTILVSALIYIIFKLFSKYNIDTFQAIVVNYFVCAITGFTISGFASFEDLYINVKPALAFGIFLGILFIIVFNFIALTSQKFGVSVASLADRINLIIPVIFAFLFLGDKLTVVKSAGILLSIIAIVLALSKDSNAKNKELGKLWYYPLIVFFGGGILGTVLKYVQYTFEGLSYSGFLVISFTSAFLIGSSLTLLLLGLGKTKIDFKSWGAGILLAIPNFFSLYWFLKALDVPQWESSVIFPVNNIGILVLTTLFGVLFFKEKLSRRNQIGILLAILSISLLIYERLHG